MSATHSEQKNKPGNAVGGDVGAATLKAYKVASAHFALALVGEHCILRLRSICCAKTSKERLEGMTRRIEPGITAHTISL